MERDGARGASPPCCSSLWPQLGRSLPATGEALRGGFWRRLGGCRRRLERLFGRAKTVYVVDADRTFSSFDPRSKTFHDIGVLNCPGRRRRPAVLDVRGARRQRVRALRRRRAVQGRHLEPRVREDDVLGFGVQELRHGVLDRDRRRHHRHGCSSPAGQTVGTMSKLARLDVSSFTVGAGVDIVGWPELTRHR